MKISNFNEFRQVVPTNNDWGRLNNNLDWYGGYLYLKNNYPQYLREEWIYPFGAEQNFYEDIVKGNI